MRIIFYLINLLPNTLPRSETDQHDSHQKMTGNRLYDQVLYTHGEGSYIIRLAEKVYVFAWIGEGNSQFSIDPWSFLKFGYFYDVEDCPDLPAVLAKIDQDVKALNHENKLEYLCSLVTAEEVKKAWEEFVRKYDIQITDE